MLMQRVEPPRKSAQPAHPARHVRRAAVAMLVRCVTALVGGYALMSVAATLVARLLPIERAEATVWSMVPAFFFYATVALWCFHEPRTARVAASVWGAAIVAGGAVWLLGVRA